jgi:hypothetical protein
MAYEIPGYNIGTLTAVGNYSSATSQYKVVKSTGAGTFSIKVTSTDSALGVLQDLPSSGYVGNIMFSGITKVRVMNATHGAIAVGDKLCGSTGGGVIGSTNVNRYVLGRALQAQAVNTTGIISMLLTHEGAGSTSAAAGA